MSGIKHYIEMNSANRDRFLYPNPAEFIVNFQNTIDRCSCLAAFNPVSNAYPIYNFQSSDNINNRDIPQDFNHPYASDCQWGGGNSVEPNLLAIQAFTCVVVPGAGDRILGPLRVAIGDKKVYNEKCPLTKLADDYYNGMELKDPAGGFSALITSYKIEQSPLCTVMVFTPPITYPVNYIPTPTLENSLNVNFDPSMQVFTIANTNTYDSIRIQGGPPTTGAYCGYYLECVNISLGSVYLPFKERFKKIISYDGVTRIAILESKFDSTAVQIPPNPTLTTVFPIPRNHYFNNFFRIRKELPCVMGWGNFTYKGIEETDTTAPLTPYFPSPPASSGCCQLSANFHDVIPFGSTGIDKSNSTTGGVYEVEIVESNTGTWNTLGIYADVSVNGTAEIYILNVINNSVCTVRINKPGNSYSVGQCIEIDDGLGHITTFKVVKTGTSFNINNGISGTFTGNLSQEYNEYKGSIFYVLHRGPEYNNMNNLSDTNNNIFAAYPEYYRQYPLQFCTQQNYKEGYSGFDKKRYNFDITGTTCILAYIVSYDILNPETPLEIYVITLDGITDFTNDILWPNALRCGGSGASLSETTYDWEILPFSYDSVNSMNYTGSITSQEQMVCYKVRISNLILPNDFLRSGFGGIIAFYPYVYVELNNESAPSGHQRGLIYSNNPHSTKATFRVALNDINKPIISKFVKQKGDMIQTIKFKPNDNLKLRIFFSDGDTFTTVTPDNVPPEMVNPLLQICALFQIERL